MATAPTIGFGVAGTAQIFYTDLASYQAFNTQNIPIRPGCVIIDPTTTPCTILGISDGAGGFTGGLTPAQVAQVQALVSGAWKLAQAPLIQVLTSAIAGGPTVTDEATGTSSIASKQTFSKDSSCFVYVGASLGPWNPNTAYIACSDVSVYMEVTFCSDAPVLELIMVRYTSKICIFVDDQPVVSTQFSLDSAGTADLIKIDYGTTRKWRTYRVGGFNMPFGGIYVGPNDSVAAPVDLRPLISIGLADSYTQGTYAGATMLSCMYTMTRLLNARFWADCVGGTGYNSASSNVPATRLAARENALQKRVGGVNSALVPDLSIWALGYNDAGGDMVALRAAFDAGYAAAASKPKVIMGPWTPLGATTNLDLVRTALQAAATYYGIHYTDVRNWINSVNKTVLTAVDNIHPNQSGHDQIAYLGAQDLQQVPYRALAF